MKKLGIFGILMTGILLQAGINLLENPEFSDGMKNWQAGSYPHKIENGAFCAEIPSGQERRTVVLSQSVKLKPDTSYLLSFKLKSGGGALYLSCHLPNPDSALGLDRNIPVKPGENAYRLAFTTTRPSWGDGARLTFDLYRLKGAASLSGLKLEETPRLDFLLNPTWTRFANAVPPESFQSMPSDLKGEHHGRASADKVQLTGNRIEFLRAQNGDRKSAQATAVFYNEFDSPEEGVMPIGFSADREIQIFFNGEAVFSGRGSPGLSLDDIVLELPVRKGTNLLAVKVRSLPNRDGVFICGKPEKTILFTPGDEWKALTAGTSGNIKAGSALDLSGTIDAPAGKYGRLVVNENGRAVFEQKPEEPVRMLGFNAIASNLFTTESDSEFKEKITTLARAARRQGYRIFRVHGFLDRWLSEGTSRDMEINPKYLNRWDYLISEFKKEGVYIHLVIFSFNLYTKNHSMTAAERDLHKLMMYLNGDWEMERFRYAADTLFPHVNPYTGIAWKDEPAIAVVEFYNEQCIALERINAIWNAHQQARQAIEARWREWLAEKYRDGVPEPIRKALRGKTPATADYPLGRNDALSAQIPLFWLDRGVKSAQACEKIVRDAGYPGLTTQFSYSKTLGSSAARWEASPVTDVHSYFKHPVSFGNRGSFVGQESSVEEAAGYWRSTNSTKLAGRPFMVGEFNHCFPNRYRYEAGLVFGSYSALQDYASLCVHSHPVLPEAEQPFAWSFSSASPIVRASQFLIACLFQRGDLKPSPHLVSLVIPDGYLEKRAGGALYSEQAKLALLSGFGLNFPDRKIPAGLPPVPKADLNVLPVGASKVEANDWFTDVVDSPSNSSFSLDNMVDLMKKRGILKPDNQSIPSKGIFQSDTGEILLNTEEKLLKVTTPRSEGVCVTGGKTVDCTILRRIKSSVDGSIALCSVDGKPLSSSSRMLLVYSTEEVNTNMELSSDRRIMIALGVHPVLLHVGTLEAVIDRPAAGMSLYALGFDGSRLERLTVMPSETGMTIHINTGTLKYGPTVFFELVQE